MTRFLAFATLVLLNSPLAAEPKFSLPVDCIAGKTCFVQSYVDTDPSPAAKDYTCGTRTYEAHNGTDIRILSMKVQREGVAVLAAADGTVLRGRDGVPDISVRTLGKQALQGQDCGNGMVIDHGEGWTAQYCHMAQGSVTAKPGDKVQRGAPIGKVGLSGNTEFPHLHITFRRNGEVVDPFSVDAKPGTCGLTRTVWTPEVEQGLAYRSRIVLNTGFADRVLTMDEVENGVGAGTLSQNAPAMVAFVRSIGLEAGDVQTMTITNPKGEVMVTNALEALDRPKAQYVMSIGRKRPADGFPPGRYEVTYRVTNQGKLVTEERFGLDF